MDQDIFLNALSAADVKAAYESNADTNAFTDALLSKINGIEENAKDDQDADEVPYNNANSGLTATDVEGAINEVEGRLDTAESDITTHINATDNPHSVTAEQVGLGNVTNESKATMFTDPTFTGAVSGVDSSMVGLGNVTNESKATMFTDPEFTGVPIAPTAALNTDTTQIATTAFVQQEIAVIDGGEFPDGE
jgi:hypothetical protein